MERQERHHQERQQQPGPEEEEALFASSQDSYRTSSTQCATAGSISSRCVGAVAWGLHGATGGLHRFCKRVCMGPCMGDY